MMRLLALAFSVLTLSMASMTNAADGPTVLITGANRGIGLEYARQFAANGYEVIGTARDPADTQELSAVTKRIEQLDVTDAASVAALAKRLQGVPIDILVNNAGVFDRRDITIDKVDFAAMEQTFAVNTLGPLRVTQTLLPNLRASKRRTIVNMSSQLGSIEGSNGQWYAYRASKAALNQINKTLSAELASEGFISVVLHPGWVRTDMGGAGATYSPQESVAGLIKVIEKLGPTDNGRFYDFRGNPIPW
ncbi:MAG: SDR family oxidoreductase [Burkholderiales bacterium]|jgi:NAD(P)-dependent dehydrogenase (short-subunit alcohol dehydrogenase family)|nr:SDR family oxidoreductase [Burkholderiales bacterium]